MFDTPMDAAEFLGEYLEGPVVERILGTLVPTITFAPLDEDRVGGIRIGGVPDMAPGAEWPRPPAPDEARRKQLVEFGGDELRAHLDGNLPYAFIGQFDLAEIAALGEIAVPLPDEGRLLFFYDWMAGPYETGGRVGKVIWDRTPVADLQALDVPSDLLAAHHDLVGDFAKIAAQFGDERLKVSLLGNCSPPVSACMAAV